MPYIIADPCVSTCDTACVEVCPVDCIHGPDDTEGAGDEAKEEGFDPKDPMAVRFRWVTQGNQVFIKKPGQSNYVPLERDYYEVIESGQAGF